MSGIEYDYRRSWEQAQRERLTDPAECVPGEVGFVVRVPPCLCDRDIRRARGDLAAQDEVVTAALAAGSVDARRILWLLARNYADHPDFRREWAEG